MAKDENYFTSCDPYTVALKYIYIYNTHTHTHAHIMNFNFLAYIKIITVGNIISGKYFFILFGTVFHIFGMRLGFDTP